MSKASKVALAWFAVGLIVGTVTQLVWHHKAMYYIGNDYDVPWYWTVTGIWLPVILMLVAGLFTPRSNLLRVWLTITVSLPLGFLLASANLEILERFVGEAAALGLIAIVAMAIGRGIAVGFARLLRSRDVATER